MGNLHDFTNSTKSSEKVIVFFLEFVSLMNLKCRSLQVKVLHRQVSWYEVQKSIPFYTLMHIQRCYRVTVVQWTACSLDETKASAAVNTDTVVATDVKTLIIFTDSDNNPILITTVNKALDHLFYPIIKPLVTTCKHLWGVSYW